MSPTLRLRPANLLKITLAVLPLLFLAPTASSIMPTPDYEGGIWVPTPYNDCGAGKLCLEWELTNGTHPDVPCCLEPSYLGSTMYRVCPHGFRHPH